MTTELFVSADGGPRPFDGVERRCLRPEAALAAARPGTTLRFFGEIYDAPIVVARSGERGAPIRLIGAPGAVVDGGQRPHGAGNPERAPYDRHPHGLRLDHCAWVEIAGFSFRHCWPTAIYGRGAQDVVIRDVEATGGQFFLYLRRGGAPGGPRRPTRGVRLERVRWTQDPERLMWSGEVGWSAIKDWRAPESRFDGALVGGWMVAGDVAVERCRVSQAFGGVRLDAAPGSPVGAANVDVRVTDCDFDHIRGNAVEPEKTGLGWWVSGCRLRNVHAAFALRGATGGGFYLWGNLIANLDRPKDPTGRTGGGVLKLGRGETTFVSRPICLAHNSVVVASAYATAGSNEHLIHVNNAIHCLDPAQPLFWGDEGRLEWRESWRWLGDVCNHECFPDRFPASWGFAIDGARAADVFADPEAGDLRPLPGGPIAPGPAGRPPVPPRAATIPTPDGEVALVDPEALVGAIQRDGRQFDGLRFAPSRPVHA